MSLPKAEKYLEDDEVIHRKLIVACEIITENELDLEDGEETRSLLMHEKMFNRLSFS